MTAKFSTASRDLFATAELLVKLTIIVNCHFVSASGNPVP